MVTDAQVFGTLKGYVGTIVARSIMQTAAASNNVDLNQMSEADLLKIIPTLENGIRAFNNDPGQVDACLAELRAMVPEFSVADPVSSGLVTPVRVEIHEEYDVVLVRSQSMTLCDELGFSSSEKVKVTTVASELARNIVQYVGNGHVDFSRIIGGRPGIEIHAVDRGPGITDIDTVLSGGYVSKTGMGMGLIGARRLMDDFEIKTGPGQGTEVIARKYVTC